MDDLKKLLERDMIVGSVLNGSHITTNILWDWMNPDYATIAFIGDNDKSARKKIVSKIARNIHQHDPKIVYWITSDQSGLTFPAEADDSITWLEDKPDLPHEYDPDQLFRERRGIFPATYFHLIAGKGGFNFRDYVSSISYLSHIEGPLMGYRRIFHSLNNHGVQKVLQEAVEATGNVMWHLTPEGRKCIIPAGKSIYEKAAAMVLAMWNFWAQICRLDHPQQFLLILEPDKEIMLGEHESELKNYIFRMFEIMRSLSEEITMSLVLSLETMFPVPELGIRTRVLLQTHQSDFDMFTPEHKAFFGPLLYEEWSKGNNYVAYIQDIHIGENCIGEFSPEKIEFIEEQTDLSERYGLKID